jgi:hypothetical protein
VTHPDDCCSVVELRRYTLQPGQRDTLVELFDAELTEPQEAVGMHIVGQFRDLDDPDKFVWVRGFPSMDQRRESLEAFYRGPVWKQHSAAANATMVDSDDVLLLRPLGTSTRAGHGGVEAPPGGSYTVEIHPVAGGTAAGADPAVLDGLPTLPPGSETVGAYASLAAENTFPALPVREDVVAIVRVAAHRTQQDADAHVNAAGPGVVTHRLSPTAGSHLS